MHCRHHKKKDGGCKARLRKNMVTGVFQRADRHQHNHLSEHHLQGHIAVINAVVAAAETSRDQPKKIFDGIR